MFSRVELVRGVPQSRECWEKLLSALLVEAFSGFFGFASE
jgi:hypothetical protein